MSKKLVVVIAATFIVAGIASYAGAFGEAIPTRVGIERTGKLWKLVAKAPKEDPFSLPECGLESTLAFSRLAVMRDGGLLECQLAAGTWKLLGKCEPGKFRGFKYKHINASPDYPCKIVILKERVIKVLAVDSGTLPAIASEGNGITEMDLRLPGVPSLPCRYCAEWGEDGYFKAVAGKLLKEKDALAPATCLSAVCTENGDDPQCEYPSDPCTDGTCAISGNVCSTYTDCSPGGLEQCCCHGTYL